MNSLEKHLIFIREFCTIHKVKSLFVFGSVTTDKYDEKSDVDLLVEFEDIEPLEYATHYFELKFLLQDLLNKPIDLLENSALKNVFLKEEIDKTKVLIYGK